MSNSLLYELNFLVCLNFESFKNDIFLHFVFEAGFLILGKDR